VRDRVRIAIILREPGIHLLQGTPDFFEPETDLLTACTAATTCCRRQHHDQSAASSPKCLRLRNRSINVIVGVVEVRVSDCVKIISHTTSITAELNQKTRVSVFRFGY